MKQNNIESFRDENSMGFIIQPKGIKGSLFMMVFTVFWNTFSWFMFFGLLKEKDPYAILFMGPFLLVGLFTLFLFLLSWKGTFSLLIDKEKCHGIWAISKYKYQKTIPRDEINDVNQVVLYSQNKKPVYGIAIEYGKRKKLKFGSSMTSGEKSLYVNELRSFLNLDS